MFVEREKIERVVMSDSSQNTEEEDSVVKKPFVAEEERFEVRERQRVFVVEDIQETEQELVDVPVPDIQQQATSATQRVRLQKRPVLRPENEEDIFDLEETPAYMRKNKQLNTSATRNTMTGKSTVSTRLTRSFSGDYCLSVGNPYVDKQVD
jgi:hypothetical protein